MHCSVTELFDSVFSVETRESSVLRSEVRLKDCTMTDVPAQSCRVFVRYGNTSADCSPTVEDITEIFSVHGHIVGMFSVYAFVY